MATQNFLTFFIGNIDSRSVNLQRASPMNFLTALVTEEEVRVGLDFSTIYVSSLPI